MGNTGASLDFLANLSPWDSLSYENEGANLPSDIFSAAAQKFDYLYKENQSSHKMSSVTSLF